MGAVAISADGGIPVAGCQLSRVDAILGLGVFLLMAFSANEIELYAGIPDICGGKGRVWIIAHIGVTIFASQILFSMDGGGILFGRHIDEQKFAICHFQNWTRFAMTCQAGFIVR